jgi:DNA-binding transcriptional regulator YiaG
VPAAKSPSEQLASHRAAAALPQKRVAIRLGVDLSILARWERGDRQPTGVFAGRVLRFLAASEATSSPTAVLIS